MSELRELYDQLKDEQADCPPAETIRRHTEGRLEGAEARRVAFHLADCANCVGMLERLDPADPPDLPADLGDEMAAEIGRRLGFDTEERTTEAGGRLGRLLGFRVPALVPLAVAALALALFWWVGGSVQPAGDAPEVIRQLPIFTIDQTLARSPGNAEAGPTVTTGEPFVLEVFLDRLDLEPGDRLRFVVTDPTAATVLDGDTVVLLDYNVRLALTFSKPGTYQVMLEDAGGREVERVTAEVTTAE